MRKNRLVILMSIYAKLVTKILVIDFRNPSKIMYDQVEFIPEKQSSFNIRKIVNLVYHINR